MKQEGASRVKKTKQTGVVGGGRSVASWVSRGLADTKLLATCPRPLGQRRLAHSAWATCLCCSAALAQSAVAFFEASVAFYVTRTAESAPAPSGFPLQALH